MKIAQCLPASRNSTKNLNQITFAKQIYTPICVPLQIRNPFCSTFSHTWEETSKEAKSLRIFTAQFTSWNNNAPGPLGPSSDHNSKTRSHIARISWHFYGNGWNSYLFELIKWWVNTLVLYPDFLVCCFKMKTTSRWRAFQILVGFFLGTVVLKG